MLNLCIITYIIDKGTLIILTKQTLLEQFQSYYKEHKPKNMEDAVEKFAIFGGVGWDTMDTSKPTMGLIEEIVLPGFSFIRNDVTEVTTGLPLYHSILSGVAMGDGQTHTAFKRANVSKEVGENAVAQLCESGIIRVEKSKAVFKNWGENEGVSNKLYFTSPFLRFWFAFVSPLFKGVRDGDYKEIRERFANRGGEFLHLPFVQLSYELLKMNFQEDAIVEIGEYWDKDITLDIYAKTASGKRVVGMVKYTNSKLNKSELTRLEELCENAGIEADIFVLVSKTGFSNELKALKGSRLRLLTLKNFKKLVD